MEIFGIPVLFIIFIAYLLWTNYAQEEKKKNEETAKRQQQEIIEIALRWDAISTGMNKGEVLNRLGKPKRVVEVGVEEAWGYGPSKSDGEILFVEGRVVGFQKPSCTADVFVFEIIVPQNESALDDNVTLTVKTSYASGIVEVYFLLREADETDEGKQIGYENLTATFNKTTGHWEYQLDTTGLPVGPYIILARAVHNSGEEGWVGVDVGKGTPEEVGFGYGYSYYQVGIYQKAIDFFEKNIDSNNDIDSYGCLSFLYATCPDSKFRDGKKALELAKKVCLGHSSLFLLPAFQQFLLLRRRGQCQPLLSHLS